MAFTTINKSTDYFNTKLYTGTDNSNAITGVGFQPDFTWIKSYTTASHALQDVVRGVDKTVRTNSTSAEYTNNFFTSFDSDGFTVATSESDVNSDATNYNSWNWKAGGSGSTNSNGTITSTVSANTTSGFSIVKYNGNSSTSSTIGHGLGVAPSVILLKNVGQSEGWVVYDKVLGATKYLEIDTSAVASSGSSIWYDTLPSNSVFTIGNSGKVNGGSSYAHVAYCFAEKQVYSKFGKYDGQGTTVGQFVYTGFRPAWIMVKIATTGGSDTGGWVMFNNKTYPSNLSNSPVIFANLNNAQSDSYNGEIFSNGFRFNANSVTVNGAGNTYSYMAFAEAPLVGSNDIPANAR